MPSDWSEFDEFRERWKRYEKWDAVLTDLCTTSSKHTSRADVYAKVYLIGRSYQTGIERHALPDGTGNNGMDSIAERFLSCSGQLDSLIADLGTLGDEPTKANIEAVCKSHCKVIELLNGATRNDVVPRSFASKYLHFHAPVVPIYDAYASATIARRDWKAWTGIDAPNSSIDDVDPEYWNFCRRVARMADSWRTNKLRPTARNLDIYLLGWHAKYR